MFFRSEDHVAMQDMHIMPCLFPEALKSRCGKLPHGGLSGK